MLSIKQFLFKGHSLGFLQLQLSEVVVGLQLFEVVGLVNGLVNGLVVACDTILLLWREITFFILGIQL